MAVSAVKDHASQKRRNAIMRFFIYFFLIVITAFMLLPFLWMLSSSFKENKDVFGFPIQWIPENPRWQNYVDIWTEIPLLTFIKNTAKITIVVTLLQLFTSSFAAYAFAKMQFKGKNVLFLGYIATIAVPWQAYMVPQFMMMSSWGLNNTHLAIMCLQAFSAFGVFLMKQFYEGVPSELCEAARIDGANEFRILYGIVLPMALPIIATIGMLVGLAYWNDWMNGLYYINDDNLYSIQVLLQKIQRDLDQLRQQAQGGGNMNAAELPSTAVRMALTVMGVLPIMVIYPFVQKWFVQGIAIGAVKG